jgi:hypothetical protein
MCIYKNDRKTPEESRFVELTPSPFPLAMMLAACICICDSGAGFVRNAMNDDGND